MTTSTPGCPQADTFTMDDVTCCPLCGRPNDLAGWLRPFCSYDCSDALSSLSLEVA